MRILTYSLIFVLVFLSFFMVSYLVNNNFLSLSGTNLKSALISRFVEPEEIKASYDLLDKLSSQGSGPATISNDGQSLIYYDSETGYLHKIDPTAFKNQDTSLQKLRPFLSNLQWSQDKYKVLANDSIETIFYNLSSEESKVLPQNIRFPTLSPSGDRLAYIESDPENNKNWLVISNIDLASSKKILPVTTGNWQIDWVNQNTLSLAYNNLGIGSLLEVSTDNGQLTRILSALQNLEINWSPNGQFLLYSYTDISKNMILAYKGMSNIDAELKLSTNTSASDCVWSIDNSSIFCPTNKIDDQESEDDGFVLFKLGSTPQNLNINNTSKIKAEDLLLSADEKYLFFRNIYTGSFYRLRIVVD